MHWCNNECEVRIHSTQHHTHHNTHTNYTNQSLTADCLLSTVTLWRPDDMWKLERLVGTYPAQPTYLLAILIYGHQFSLTLIFIRYMVSLNVKIYLFKDKTTANNKSGILWKYILTMQFITRVQISGTID